jgi:hypothetical protein
MRLNSCEGGVDVVDLLCETFLLNNVKEFAYVTEKL